MRKLFQYMGMYWKTVLLVFLILIVQAYCDLSLPAYTSDIVNVGIQQGGISEPVPKAVSREGMERILILLPDPEDQEKVLDAYEEDFSSYDKEAFVLKESMHEEAEEGGANGVGDTPAPEDKDSVTDAVAQAKKDAAVFLNSAKNKGGK